MFEKENRLETAFAVRYHENGADRMLLKNGRGVKMFANHYGALKELKALGQSGEVVNVCVNEVSYATPVADNAASSNVASELQNLADLLVQRPVTFYKADMTHHLEVNVIRHTPLGQKPVKQPGDMSTELDFHIQVRIDH